jgi:hypothetical protein
VFLFSSTALYYCYLQSSCIDFLNLSPQNLVPLLLLSFLAKIKAQFSADYEILLYVILSTELIILEGQVFLRALVFDGLHQNLETKEGIWKNNLTYLCTFHLILLVGLSFHFNVKCRIS